MEVLLLQGIEFTNQLQLLLVQNINFLFGDFEASALYLTNKIHQSFADALSLFNTTISGDVGTMLSDEIVIRDHDSKLNPMTMGITSYSNSDDRKISFDSKGAILGSNTDRKTGFNRRKTTRTKVTLTPVCDGHVWRKYGQKLVHNTEFPRSYYRCTNRNEQGCQATKQVQQTQDKPSMYKTTYMGYHTCKPTTSILDAIPDLILDEIHDSACFINFQTNLTTKQSNFTFSTPSFPTPVHTNEVLKPIATVHDQYPLKKPITTNHESQEQYPLNSITPVTVTDDNDFNMSEFLVSVDLSTFDSLSMEMFELMGSCKLAN